MTFISPLETAAFAVITFGALLWIVYETIDGTNMLYATYARAAVWLGLMALGVSLGSQLGWLGLDGACVELAGYAGPPVCQRNLGFLSVLRDVSGAAAVILGCTGGYVHYNWVDWSEFYD